MLLLVLWNVFCRSASESPKTSSLVLIICLCVAFRLDFSGYRMSLIRLKSLHWPVISHHLNTQTGGQGFWKKNTTAIDFRRAKVLACGDCFFKTCGKRRVGLCGCCADLASQYGCAYLCCGTGQDDMMC